MRRISLKNHSWNQPDVLDESAFTEELPASKSKMNNYIVLKCYIKRYKKGLDQTDITVLSLGFLGFVLVTPQAFLRSFTLSVFSQVNAGSFLPKWPYAEVF